LPVDQWVHVAVTLGGNTGILYVDGVPQVAGQLLLDPDDFNPTLNYIGKSQFNDPLFDGMLDDFQIYDFALEPAQIASLLGSDDFGDFNGDGAWDCADIDALTAAIASMSTDLSFDMNGDGVITLADITDESSGWLAVGGANNSGATGGNAFLLGDANLDGFVDGQDFIEWNNNKFTSAEQWCRGDFNADGFIDGQDFIEWNNTKFTSSAGAPAVPEPSAWLLGGLLAAGWVVNYRRA
jgi:hypothetical protein